jgi:hypothetical protein
MKIEFDIFTLRVPVVQEGKRNTIFFMYMIETCAFLWNFRENVNVLKNSLLNPHPTTGYLYNRRYRERKLYPRHTEWQVGISLTYFFHFFYFLDFNFMSDLLHVSTSFNIYNGILSNLYITITISYYNSIWLKCTFSSPVLLKAFIK